MRYAFWIAAAALLLAAVGAIALHGCAPVGRWGAAGSAVPNDLCRVCHTPMTAEKLVTIHALKKVWCKDCHGPSTRHMEDQNIGATPPDRTYRKDQVAALCAKCHNPNRHPKLSDEKRAECLAAGAQARTEIMGRPVTPTGICTDCHGTHWIPRKVCETTTKSP